VTGTGSKAKSNLIKNQLWRILIARDFNLIFGFRQSLEPFDDKLLLISFHVIDESYHAAFSMSQSLQTRPAQQLLTVPKPATPSIASHRFSLPTLLKTALSGCHLIEAKGVCQSLLIKVFSATKN
jgi:hypothetical protein